MLISEIYCSRQGEGILTGTPSLFVRTSGCNLRCGFCDTPFASWHPEGESLTLLEVVDRVRLIADDIRHVVITGGEPMLPREIENLCRKLRHLNYHITIETAGTIFRNLDCDLMSISPKTANSNPELDRAGEWRKKHQRTRHRPKVVRQLIQQYEYQLKFVVDAPDDMDQILGYLELIQPVDPTRVLLMPQGIKLEDLVIRGQWLEPICQQHGFTFCPRRQIEWYGNKRGT